MASPTQILGYDVLGVLGHGARSTIYAVRDPADAHVYALKQVIKQSPSDQRFLDQAILEHEIASRFAHPSIRQSFKIFRQRKFLRTCEVLVLMELINGVTLETHKSAGIRQLCQMFLHVAAGLGEMHAGGIVHADIKPANIMLADSGAVKIIDFGQSCPTGTVKERIQGTPDYIAPEQVMRKRITPRTDVFNLGATMYWLLTGKHVPTLMPKGRPGIDIRSTERSCPAVRELNTAVPPVLSILIMECVENSPRNRPESMEQVQQRLQMAITHLDRESAQQVQAQIDRALAEKQSQDTPRPSA